MPQIPKDVLETWIELLTKCREEVMKLTKRLRSVESSLLTVWAQMSDEMEPNLLEEIESESAPAAAAESESVGEQ